MKFFNFFKRKMQSETADNNTSFEDEINAISTGNHSELSQESLSGNDLEFIDYSKLVYTSLPIQLAKNVPISSRSYLESANKKFTFPICPGMFDYSQVGYIMPSWVDFHFIANKAGVRAIAGGNPVRGSHFKDPVYMSAELVEGLFKIYDDIPLQPFNLNSPWKIFSKRKSISALILPAFYHMDPEILENLYIYPGIVDYDKFHTANVICAVRRNCQFTIKAGEPLVHIIPFVNSEIVCGYGPATDEQESQINYDPNMYQKQYYRKNHHTKKTYILEDNDETNNMMEQSNTEVEELDSIDVIGSTEEPTEGPTEEMIPGTEIIIPGTEIIIPGTEIVNPGTEIMNPEIEVVSSKSESPKSRKPKSKNVKKQKSKRKKKNK